MDEAHDYDIEVGGGEASVIARIGPVRQCLARESVPEGPDTIAHALEDVCLAELDGRSLSTQVAGGFTGRVVGMDATGGSAAFDWFEYEGLPPFDSCL